MNNDENDASLEQLVFRSKINADEVYKGVVLPTLLLRVKALFVDLCVMLLVFTSITLFIDSVGDISNFVKGFILIFMFFLYDPLLTSLAGGTLGHKLMKLKIRRYEEPERNISLWQASLRFFIKGALGWISFLTVTGTKHKRAIHDMTSGSIILRDK
jgi:uncharacterized RDD family membrane protein YckC